MSEYTDCTQEELEEKLRIYWEIVEGRQTLPERREKVRIAMQRKQQDLTLDILQKGRIEQNEMLSGLHRKMGQRHRKMPRYL